MPRLDPASGKRPGLHSDGSKPHKFAEPLPRRHAKSAGGGSQCVECEHVLDRHEGPQTTRRQLLTIREAADALTLVGHALDERYGCRNRASRRHDECIVI